MNATANQRATRETLAALATLESDLGAVRAQLHELADEYQAGRTSVRTAMAALDHERRLLKARQEPVKAGDEGSLKSIIGSVGELEAEHARRLAEFEQLIKKIEARRAKLQTHAESVEARQRALLAKLPQELARHHDTLRRRGVAAPIATIVDGACAVCGEPRERDEEGAAADPVCEGCGRFLIPAVPSGKHLTA